MFCFPLQSQRKDRRRREFAGLTSDFSQSVSALNHLTLPGNSDCLANLCHSDSNISNLHSFSLLKSAVKLKSMLSGSGSKRNVSEVAAVSTECVLEDHASTVVLVEPPFDVKGDISFIDGEPISPSKDSVSVVNVSEVESSAEVVSTVQPPLTNNMRAQRPRDLAPVDLVSAVDVASSSGNSSSSLDVIAPMASPEKLSPPESGVCSPALLDLHDVSPCPRLRYQLLSEGDVQVCQLNHTRTIVSKVLSSKFLRRWETHHVQLGDANIFSRTVRIAFSFFSSLASTHCMQRSMLGEGTRSHRP